MTCLLAACKYLTLWGRLHRTPPAPETIGRATLFFPFVGFLLGLLLALLNYALGIYVDSDILAILLIAVLLAATGGTHLDGLKKTFDALASESARATDSNNALFGFIAVLFVILFKISSINALGEKIAVSLLLAPMLARWALVLFVYGFQDRFEDSARWIAANVGLWQVFVTSGSTVGAALYLLGRKGLWICLSVSVFALLARSLLHRRHGVLCHNHFGAVIELSEALGLLLLASL